MMVRRSPLHDIASFYSKHGVDAIMAMDDIACLQLPQFSRLDLSTALNAAGTLNYTHLVSIAQIAVRQAAARQAVLQQADILKGVAARLGQVLCSVPLLLRFMNTLRAATLQERLQRVHGCRHMPLGFTVVSQKQAC